MHDMSCFLKTRIVPSSQTAFYKWKAAVTNMSLNLLSISDEPRWLDSKQPLK